MGREILAIETRQQYREGMKEEMLVNVESSIQYRVSIKYKGQLLIRRVMRDHFKLINIRKLFLFKKKKKIELKQEQTT